MSQSNLGQSGASHKRLVERAQRDVLEVITRLVHYNARAGANHNEDFRQAFVRLCELRDALMDADAYEHESRARAGAEKDIERARQQAQRAASSGHD